MFILFIAVRNHHYRYFKEISKDWNVDVHVTKANRIFKLSFSVLFSLPYQQITKIVELKVQEKVQATGQYRLPFFVKAWLFARYWVLAIVKYSMFFRLIHKASPKHLAMWGGPMFNQSIARLAASQQSVELLFFENGHLPDTTVVDTKGVNYFNSVPSEPEFYHALHKPTFASVNLEARKLNKARKADKELNKIPLPDKYIFVPFQLDVDRQILVHSPWVKNMVDFYNLITSNIHSLPDDWHIVFKEHPSSAKSYPYLRSAASLTERVMFANEYSTQELINGSQCVVTINSTVGLESLIYSRPVVTLGEAFFNISGLVNIVENEQQLPEVFRSLKSLTVSQTLRDNFLGYLKDDYLVNGDWKESNAEHITAMRHRIMEIVEN